MQQKQGLKMLVPIITALAVICFFSVAGAQQSGQTGYATERGQQQQYGQQDQRTQPQYGQRGQEQRTQQWGQASQQKPLVGRDVRDQSGEEIGEIKNVVTSPDGNVQVIVSHGGWLGIGAREVALSMQDFQIPQQDDHVVFNGTKEQLENLPEYREPEDRRDRFAERGGPDRYGPYGYYPPAYPPDRYGYDYRGEGRMGSRWDEGATRDRAPMGERWDRGRQWSEERMQGGRPMDYGRGYYQEQRPIQQERVKGETAVRITDVIGQQVQSKQGQQLGKVDDVVVTVDGGKAFAILTTEQQRGQQPGQNLVAIPFENLEISQGRLVSSMSQQELQRQRPFTYESGYEQQRLHRFQAMQQQRTQQQQERRQ